MSDDSKEPKVEFDRSLYEFFSKAEKVAEAKKEEEAKAKKRGKVLGKILRGYMIFCIVVVTLLILAIIGWGLSAVLSTLFHGLIFK